MQPYQEAGDTTRNSGESALNTLKYAGAGAIGTAGAAAGRSIVSRMIPLLSSYIPESLAKKGLEKISPKFGQFIQKAEDEGYDFNEIRDFFTQKLKKDEEQQQPAKQDRNIIEQYSPELHQFILGEIKNGRSPLQAGALATMERTGSKGFKKEIEKITKDHKVPWATILETVYGAGEQAQKGQDVEQEQGMQQRGKGEASLMAMIQNLQKARATQ